MQTQPPRIRTLAFAVGLAIATASGWASADPPSRVARLGYMTGTVSFSPAGENDWVNATINRPLTTGDRLWSDARARTELQIGGATIRMSADTGLSILNLDDSIAQLQLTQGTLSVRVRRLEPNQVFEVDTPNLAFTLRRPGEYRISVDPDGRSTSVIVRSGQGEAYGEGASYVIDSRQSYRFTGVGLREYEYLDAFRPDEFDRWASDRDRRYDNSVSARYVSQDVVGYEDLDANGTWRQDGTYGSVWFPNRVASGWAPYRDGHWSWIDPWGWTWVDDAPWGFAVSHYGRWTNLRGSWGWVPGPLRTRAYYAPALVAFVGGNNFQLTVSSGNVGGVAWFPLAPREVYRPAYTVSRGYFENINRSNTVVNTTVINNYYNNSNVTNIVYANRQVAGAVIAVPTSAFVQSQQVSRAAVRVSRDMNIGGQAGFVAPVAPTERSVRGAAAQAGRPPGRAFERPVVARTAPPEVRSGFVAQQEQLASRQGRPLDDAARRQLRPASNAPAPVVKVVAPAQVAPPTAPPPRVAPSNGNGRGNADQRGRGELRGQPMAPPPVNQQTAPAPAAAQQQEQRGRPDQRGREQRGQPPAQQQSPPPQSQSPQQIPQPAAATPPAAQQQEQRGRPDQRGRGEQRGQPMTPPPISQQVAPPTPAAEQPVQRARPEQRGRVEERGQPVAPPQAPAQAAPAAPPPDQRGRPEQRGRAEQRGQPVPTPQAAPPAAPQPPANAEPRGRPSTPTADREKEPKKDRDEQARDEENDKGDKGDRRKKKD
jgi:hypothetical protein